MLLGSILAGSGVRALEPVPTVPPPKSWENFVVLVWQFQTELPRDKALYESVNLKGFHIDYVDPRLQTFAKESGWPYYVDHAARKGYLHLRDKDVDPIMAQFKKSKQALPRPNSLADPKTVETMKANLKASIGAAKGGAAVAYAYDDEISTGSFASPVETDAGPQGLAYYRKYLKELYGGDRQAERAVRNFARKLRRDRGAIVRAVPEGASAGRPG
ncbi:MAG: hypothetical protein M5U26_18295 [Planctomycetota bacterium]|nr:hypothetical protein [Planctomycetota bacterium]